jgi:hypothetical protein
VKYSVTGALLALCMFNSAAAIAQGGESDWSFEFAPYLLGAGMDGTASVRGVEADVDMGFDDILDHLDSAFLARFEARRGRWAVGFEGVYFRLKGEEARSWSGPLGNTNTAELGWTAIEKLFQSTLYYELLQGETQLDLLAGARYTELDTRLALSLNTGAPLLPDGSREVRRDESWIDPVIGARLRTPLSGNWYVLGLADIGGFGTGSDLTYQLFAAFGWKFAEQFSLEMGYRYLYQDFQEDEFRWDVSTSGPQLGLSITW